MSVPVTADLEGGYGERFRYNEAMSFRSERIPSKNMINCNLKNTTGSMLGRPRTA